MRWLQNKINKLDPDPVRIEKNSWIRIRSALKKTAGSGSGPHWKKQLDLDLDQLKMHTDPHPYLPCIVDSYTWISCTSSISWRTSGEMATTAPQAIYYAILILLLSRKDDLWKHCKYFTMCPLFPKYSQILTCLFWPLWITNWIRNCLQLFKK